MFNTLDIMSGVKRKYMGGAEKLRIKINRKKETDQLRGFLDNFIVKKQRTTEIISSTALSEKAGNSLNNTTSSKISSKY